MRDPQVKVLYALIKQTAQTSNANLKRNVDYLLAKEKMKGEIQWVGPSKQRSNRTKFKFTY